MIDRRLLTSFNWNLLVVTLIIAVMGLINLYSATSSFESGAHVNYFRSQVIYNIIGMVLAFLIIFAHYRYYARAGYIIYGLTILLLLIVLVMGKKVSGHQSWIGFGFIRLQPTEIAKIGLIIGMARLLPMWEARAKVGIKGLIPSFILFLIPAGLVIAQGDLGSSLFFGLVYGSLVLIHGVRWKILAVLTAAAVLLSIFAYFYVLSPYQKNRILTFMNPELDRKGSGYHLIQSKIAVGSGGWIGKGYMKGQTHKLKFIPERHTDFIFPVFAEEWGFLGSFFVLTAYGVFLFIILSIAQKSVDRFSFFVASGIGALFFWHLVINLGGVLGLMPLTGVPLPFFSYGGSSLISSWLGIGLLLNISMRRFAFGSSNQLR